MCHGTLYYIRLGTVCRCVQEALSLLEGPAMKPILATSGRRFNSFGGEKLEITWKRKFSAAESCHLINNPQAAPNITYPIRLRHNRVAQRGHRGQIVAIARRKNDPGFCGSSQPGG